MKKILLLSLLVANALLSSSQVNRKVTPVTRPGVITNPSQSVNTNAAAPGVTKIPAENFINRPTLHFAYRNAADADCRGPQCYYWEYITTVWRDANNTPGSSNWKEPLLWRRVPKTAVYGKYEISLSPFTGNNEILQSGLIETNGRDSVFFEIGYTDVLNKIEGRINKQPAGQNPFSVNKGSTIFRATDKRIFDVLNDIPSNRKYFIRITALDANKNILGNVSNEVTLIQSWATIPQAKANNAPSIYSDYTITAVKYVPVHFANPSYYGCTVVTGYNESMFKKTPPGFTDAEYQQLIQQFLQSYPVGKKICPDPPEDKPWYKKAFKGVTGFVTKAVDGAANFYNDTKNYVKGKFADAFCSDNVVKNLAAGSAASGANQTPNGLCQKVAGYAFDGAMAAAGIPPSLPNTDDLTKMAEGQVIDLACDKMERESGVPVPEELRNQMKKEFQQQVQSSSNSRMVDCGFLRVKPHPEGFFQTAYLEIEVTRTGNNFKNKAIAGIGIENKCERSDIFCENCNPYDKENKKLRFNLFERTFTEVPFLKNAGDKIKLIVVLKPQESWIHKNSSTGKIKWIEKAYPLNEWITPVEPTYEGAASSAGFNMLCNKSAITFNFGGMKIADGVTTTFYHQ